METEHDFTRIESASCFIASESERCRSSWAWRVAQTVIHLLHRRVVRRDV